MIIPMAPSQRARWYQVGAQASMKKIESTQLLAYGVSRQNSGQKAQGARARR
jgi:hypothetical protein